MRTRLTVTALLTLGVLMSGTGTSMAISGAAGGGSAGGAQYPQIKAVESGLPFTGWAVIPLILLGIGLIGYGALLRRAAAARSS
jgi:hypothetical protein